MPTRSATVYTPGPSGMVSPSRYITVLPSCSLVMSMGNVARPWGPSIVPIAARAASCDQFSPSFSVVSEMQSWNIQKKFLQLRVSSEVRSSSSSAVQPSNR